VIRENSLLICVNSFMRHFHKTIVILIIILTLLGVFTIVRAAFNEQINYQGKLTDTSNVAVSDGNHCMRFSLYTVASGGSPIWTEEWKASTSYVVTSSGLFSVLLGSHTSLSSLNFNQSALYLQVDYDPGCDDIYEEVFSPRKQLAAVPAAFEAKQLGGYTWEAPGAIGATTPSTGVFTTLTASGNVGIGDTTPDYPLEILSTASPQLAISYTDGSVYSTLGVDSSGDLTINASGGDISLGDENLTTTGTITGGTLTDGTLSISSGSISSGVDATFSGTITGGTLTDGTLSITGGDLTTSGKITTANIEIATSGLLNTTPMGNADIKSLVNKEYVDFAVTSLGASYYMYDEDDATGYKTCYLNPSADAETYIEAADLTDDAYIGGWISASGEAPSKLLKGIYNWYITLEKEKTTGTKDLRVYWKLIERKSGGSETVIATSSNSNIITDKRLTLFLYNWKKTIFLRREAELWESFTQMYREAEMPQPLGYTIRET